MPKPIIASGRWEARQFLDLSHKEGKWGPLATAILKMRVRLSPDQDDLDSTSAVMRVVCNLSPAGQSTGKNEGVYLEIPGAPFGTFKPRVPAIGLTIISTPH